MSRTPRHLRDVTDPELSSRLSRRNMLGVAAGITLLTIAWVLLSIAR